MRVDVVGNSDAVPFLFVANHVYRLGMFLRLSQTNVKQLSSLQITTETIGYFGYVVHADSKSLKTK